MNNKEVGAYLGVDASTIRTWLLVDSLIPGKWCRKLIAGKVSLHSARSLERGDGRRARNSRLRRRHKDLFQRPEELVGPQAPPPLAGDVPAGDARETCITTRNGCWKSCDGR